MSEDNLTKCPHGITKADRRMVGCRKCDAESHDEFLAAQEAARFRVRVIQTARAVLPIIAVRIEEFGSKDAGAYALKVAEAFERAADKYIEGGGK